MQSTQTEAVLIRRAGSLDSQLLVLVVTLSAAGFVMMGSASMDYAAEQYGDPFYHIVRHAIFLVLGTGALWLMLQLPVRLWEHAGSWLLVAGIAILALVLVPGVGREVNGATRWIAFGPFNLQPSELMKLFFIVYLAGYMTRRQHEVQNHWRGMFKPLGLLGVVVLLLLLEPDFGAAVVISGTAMAMLFLGGARLLQFGVLLLPALGGAAVVAVWSPYRVQRLITFLDPWSEQFGGGYQLTQALIAFGRGEVFGVGLGNSVQKLFYLPEAHTDFVFAIIAEELGLIGCMALIALFAALVARILRIGSEAARRQQPFQAHVCFGIALLVAAQVFINIGVNAGLLPTKGLTLPFLSYGGSSLLVLLAMMGLVLRIERELRIAPVAAPAPWRLRHA
ncbi:MAG: putative lipid II flippase FtsW [Pseudomonadales bacterium]|jgi:cell division protein FtsW|nr:putative lipid II flippase FtsW [Pseudomonadales bacterium]MCP5321533.1 putative lipid II flippase FtsW [Pseudomonadales bacterium]MCP5336446.1 putative lipid II flippase FtsW [Pseudomonadales bacterium]